MAALARHVERWIAAGIITREQASRILELEEKKTGSNFVMAVVGLGGSAILIGLVSIVAANWDGIPGAAKIGIDLLLLAATAIVAARLEGGERRWVFELALLGVFGLTLASIALVGQVYQLGGATHEALALWIGLTAALMSRTRAAYTAAVWIAGIHVTWVVWMVWLAEQPGEFEGLALGLVYVAPLITLISGSMAPVRAARPALASICRRVAWTELCLAATFGLFAFYEDTAREDWGSLLPAALASAAGTAWLCFTQPSTPAGWAWRGVLVACLLCSHIPVLFSTGDLGAVSAMGFVGFWLLVALAAHRSGDVGILNLATALVGVRLLIVYFEVFGTLLDTGLALISGGLLTLFVVWLWVRKRRQFAQELEGKST